ncbi:hypothetical protein ACFL0Y_04110 [Patescibacteria group bacterium]
MSEKSGLSSDDLFQLHQLRTALTSMQEIEGLLGPDETYLSEEEIESSLADLDSLENNLKDKLEQSKKLSWQEVKSQLIEIAKEEHELHQQEIFGKEE